MYLEPVRSKVEVEVEIFQVTLCSTSNSLLLVVVGHWQAFSKFESRPQLGKEMPGRVPAF